MMHIIEITSICLSIILCIVCTISDLRTGYIYNTVLLVLGILAIVLDATYYGLFARSMLHDFLLNLLIIVVVSSFLFYSRSFAGGDCKFAIVLALLYPARYYYEYGDSVLTLAFTIGLAILAGYIYLLVNSVCAISMGKVRLTGKYVKKSLISFLKSYMAAMLYLALLNCLLVLCTNSGITINKWASRCVCLIVAWCVGRYSLFLNRNLLLLTSTVVLIISLVIKKHPISLDFENYTIILVLLLCQMTIRTTIYESVPIEKLKKGMILTTYSSLLMQNSITKGLPSLSTEDLRSRLSAEEIVSIKKWAQATQTEELYVIKKIPFAVFLSIGFIGYFILQNLGV